MLFISRGEIRMCHNLSRNEIDSRSTKFNSKLKKSDFILKSATVELHGPGHLYCYISSNIYN